MLHSLIILGLVGLGLYTLVTGAAFVIHVLLVLGEIFGSSPSSQPHVPPPAPLPPPHPSEVPPADSLGFRAVQVALVLGIAGGIVFQVVQGAS